MNSVFRNIVLNTLLICSVIAAFSIQAEPFATPYRYGEGGYGYGGYRNQPPVWHRSGLFEKRDLMNSMLYGAFGLKYDRLNLNGVKLGTVGGYLEFCNIMLDFTYRQNHQYKAYDAGASFLIPFHPNFQVGPRLEYMGICDRAVTDKFDNEKFNIGLTVDLHFRYVSIICNISKNSIGIGVGWAFGRI